MRAEGLAVAALLLAPVAFAQVEPSIPWDQAGGDPARSSSVPALRSSSLDVLKTVTLFQGDVEQLLGTHRHLLMIETHEGLFASINPNVQLSSTRVLSCSWLRIRDPFTLEPERAPAEPCNAPRTILAYDAASDRVFVDDGSGEVVALEAATLAEAWRVAAPVAQPGPRGCCAPALRAVDALLRPEELVVLWADQSSIAGNGLASIDPADGSVNWRTTIHSNALLGGQGSPFDLAALATGDAVSRADPESGFLATAFAATTTGYLVSGLDRSIGVGAAWLTSEGRVISGDVLLPSPDEPSLRARTVSTLVSRPSAHGSFAAMLLGDRIIVVDPTSSAPARFPRDADDMASIPGEPLWVGDQFLAARAGGISSYDAGDFSIEWTWGGIPGGIEHDMLVSGDDVLVLAGSRSRLLNETVVRLDRATGREIQRLPIPGFNSSGSVAQLLPLSDGRGALVILDLGNVTVLGEADPSRRPAVGIEDSRPSVGASFRVSLPTSDAVNGYLVAWGDGELSEAAPATDVTHRYEEARPVTLRVTALYADGTTATSERVIRVGETPLTPIQAAFSEKNQNVTFFLLGLALTGGGAVFAAILRRRRHARLAKEEALLRRIIDASLLEPTKGLASLEAHREHLRDAHTRRRIDDAQFGLLDARTVRAMKSARYRLLGPALNKLSPHFRRLLDTALEDGQVTHGEMSALVATLEGEGALAPEERERIRALLAAWAR